MDGESNEDVYGYGKCYMSCKGEELIGVVEIVKHSTLRWLGHLERMDE